MTKEIKESKNQVKTATVTIKKKKLNVLIHQKLDELLAGDLFVEIGLTEKDYGHLLSDNELYNKFEALLGDTLVTIAVAKTPEKQLSKKEMKKSMKEHVATLKLMSSHVKAEIEAHQKLTASKRKDQTSTRKQTGKENYSERKTKRIDSEAHKQSNSLKNKDQTSKRKRKCKENHSNSLENNISASGKKLHTEREEKKSTSHHQNRASEPIPLPTKQKIKTSIGNSKKVKKKVKGKSSKVKPDIPNPNNVEDMEEDIRSNSGSNLDSEVHGANWIDGTREKAERDFNMEKDDIMHKIDEFAKEDFREIGFAKWNTKWLPIIQLSPYDTGEPVRGEWMKIYIRWIKNKKIKMPRMVYWYGTPKDNLSTAFSFIPKCNVVSYEDGVSKNRHILPERIKKKINEGKKLSYDDALLRNGLVQQEEELALSKEERVSWINEPEEFESLPWADKNVDQEAENSKVETGNEFGDDHITIKPILTDEEVSETKTLKKKRKKEATSAEQKKKAKRSSKRPKIDSSDLDGNQDAAKTTKGNVHKVDTIEEDMPLNKFHGDEVLTTKKGTNKRKKSKQSKGAAKISSLHVEETKESIGDSEDETLQEVSLHSPVPEEEGLSLDPILPSDGEKKVKTKVKKKQKKGKKRKNVSANYIESENNETSDDVSPKTNQGTDCHVNIGIVSQSDIDDLKPAAEKTKKNKKQTKKQKPKVEDDDAIDINPKFEPVKEETFVKSIKSDDENPVVKSETDSEGSLSADNGKKVEAPLPNEMKDEEAVIINEEKQDKNLRKIPQIESDEICENVLLPIMEHLRIAVDHDDVNSAKEKLREIQQNVQFVTPSIISKHKLGILVKETREKFTENKEMNTLAKAVTKMIKEEYFKKKNASSLKKNEKTPRDEKMENVVPKRHGANGNISTQKPRSRKATSASHLPEWLWDEASFLNEHSSYKSNSDRTFAMEFFTMAVAGFANDVKDVNPSCVARALEAAAFELHEGVSKNYWEKLHAVCGAIVGKRNQTRITELARRILKGDYATAKEVLELPLKKLYEHFDGCVT